MEGKGQRILAGRYRIERRLGEGASGTVWFVRDTREKGRVWALKELDYSSLPLDEQAEAWALFKREADMLMQLDHPCLPRVVERFQEEGRHYLVMERVEGPTLESVLKARSAPLPEQEVAHWGLQLCEVLHYLHSLTPPIIYRDLKPSNVMVSVRGPIKLVDFGIARVLNPNRPGDTTAYGTPGYAPLEQYVGKATPRSDLYALGVTLYQLLTLQEPEQFRFKFPPARDFNIEVSADFEELLEKLTQKEEQHRPASAQVVGEQLARIAARKNPWWWKASLRLEKFFKKR